MRRRRLVVLPFVGFFLFFSLGCESAPEHDWRQTWRMGTLGRRTGLNVTVIAYFDDGQQTVELLSETTASGSRVRGHEGEPSSAAIWVEIEGCERGVGGRSCAVDAPVPVTVSINDPDYCLNMCERRWVPD